MSKTTRLLARKSAEPNILRTSAGPDHAARSTIENQRRRGCSASGCFLQNSTSVFLAPEERRVSPHVLVIGVAHRLSAQRIRFQLREPERREGLVSCKP